jgi:hypothetical protein
MMSTKELRQEIKKAVDRLPAERLESLADYVAFLGRASVDRRIKDGERAIAAGEGVNWRTVRSDVPRTDV